MPHNVTWTRAFPGRGKSEQTQETSTFGTPNYTYSLLGLTTIVGSTATYVRGPSGGLVSQQGTTGGPYYYLSDGQSSVAGLVDASGNQAARYFYCPTGNQADGPWGSAAAGNPFQLSSAFFEPGSQSFWINGVQYDANSGNAFALGGLSTKSGVSQDVYGGFFGLSSTVTLGVNLWDGFTPTILKRRSQDDVNHRQPPACRGPAAFRDPTLGLAGVASGHP